jgi:spermidine synthase
VVGYWAVDGVERAALAVFVDPCKRGRARKLIFKSAQTQQYAIEPRPVKRAGIVVRPPWDNSTMSRTPKHSIETSDEAGVRFLHFGSEWVQGAMRIARPWSLELEYTRELMLALALRPDPNWPARMLQIGLGAASVTKFIHRHRPRCHQTIVEINSAVPPVCYQMFKLPYEPERIAIEIADGVQWIADSRQRFDLILVDGYDHNARFGALGSEDFYRNCRARLSKQGVLALNLFGRSRGFNQQLANLDRVFGGRTLPLAANEEGNAVAFAIAGDTVALNAAGLRDECARLTRETGIRWGASLTRLERACAASTIQHAL